MTTENALMNLEINYESEEPRILGRKVHEVLEVQTKYSTWFPRMVEYGFEEGKDFSTIKETIFQVEENRIIGRPKVNHYLSKLMAIQVCMIQKNEIGKKIREFYINNYKLSDEELIKEIFKIVQENKQDKVNSKYLYILEMSSNLVKIGVTNNLDKRIKTLQNSSGFVVSRQYSTGLLQSDKVFQLESILHNEFKDYRKEGEYFDIEFELVVNKLNKILNKE